MPRRPCKWATHHCDSYSGVLWGLGPCSSNLAGRRQMVEEAAGGAIWSVHRAHEAPGFRQQLPHSRRPQLRKVRAPVYRAEVRQIPA